MIGHMTQLWQRKLVQYAHRTYFFNITPIMPGWPYGHPGIIGIVSEPNPCPGDVRMVDYKPELLESEVGGAH